MPSCVCSLHIRLFRPINRLRRLRKMAIGWIPAKWRSSAHSHNFSPSFSRLRSRRGNPTYQCRRLRRKRRECAAVSSSFPRRRELGTLLPFFHLRVAQTACLSPKMANHCGGFAAGNCGRQSRPAHSRIFPFLLRNAVCASKSGKNAAIIAYAIMSPLSRRLDCRSRENDELDIKSPSSHRRLSPPQHSPPCGS